MSIIKDKIYNNINAFMAMWNKLYTNQGMLLEPLLEELKKLPYSKEDAICINRSTAMWRLWTRIPQSYLGKKWEEKDSVEMQ